jgi:hypothetical protein
VVVSRVLDVVEFQEEAVYLHTAEKEYGSYRTYCECSGV